MLRLIETLSGKKLNIELTNRRDGDPPKLFANATKAKKLLNWDLKHSSLETIIETAYKWHKKNIKIK